LYKCSLCACHNVYLSSGQMMQQLLADNEHGQLCRLSRLVHCQVIRWKSKKMCYASQVIDVTTTVTVFVAMFGLESLQLVMSFSLPLSQGQLTRPCCSDCSFLSSVYTLCVLFFAQYLVLRRFGSPKHCSICLACESQQHDSTVMPISYLMDAHMLEGRATHITCGAWCPTLICTL